MRPPGEVRGAIHAAFREHGPMALRDVVQYAQVSYVAARQTLSNGLRSEVLQVVGHEKREHCKKWVALYDLAPEPDGVEAHTEAPFVVLEAALSAWR